MNLLITTANRIAKNAHSSFSKSIIRLATIGTALSVAVMILSISVVTGFKKSIKDKLMVFWDEVHVSEMHPSGMLGVEKLNIHDSILGSIKSISAVDHVYPYAIKPTILKGDGPLSGIRLKGVNEVYPFESNESIIYEGSTIDFTDERYSNDILLSPELLKRLQIKIGDEVIAFFVEEGNEGVKRRKLKVVGSFHTGVGEVDNTFAICDIRLIQRLNKWDNNEISGLQIGLKDNTEPDSVANIIYNEMIEPPLVANTVQELYPSIFSWINVQDINAQVLIIIMSIVAVINISTALLIFILERTSMIGILKALGMRNTNIQKIFLIHAFYISIKGLIWGNIVAGIIAFIQIKFKIITLDEEIYYMKYAPIHWDWINVIIVNIGALILFIFLMIIPTLIVKNVNIVKAIKFK